MSKETFRVLWTGGWDSTFRIVELSRTESEVYPVYVIDPKRKSVDYEFRAMDRILCALKSRPETIATIHEVETVKLEDIPKDKDISEAYSTIHARTKLGSQHEWLAWLGKQRPGMELGTEAGTPETSHIIQAIQEFGCLEFSNGIGQLNPHKSTKEGMLVLGWFKFPIIDRTEEDMLAQIKEWGYEDVMKNIWFCHKPINGQPCGFCHPCHVKMESKMEWLLTEKGQANYRFSKKLEKTIGSRGATIIINMLRKHVLNG